MEISTNSFLVTNFHTDEMLRHKGRYKNDVRNGFGILDHLSPFLSISRDLPEQFVRKMEQFLGLPLSTDVINESFPSSSTS